MLLKQSQVKSIKCYSKNKIINVVICFENNKKNFANYFVYRKVNNTKNIKLERFNHKKQ